MDEMFLTKRNIQAPHSFAVKDLVKIGVNRLLRTNPWE